MLSFKVFIESLDHFQPEDVLHMFDYQDNHKNLYPGWEHDEDSEYEEDYYFSSKEHAHSAAKEVLDIFKGLPDPIPVFRTIYSKDPSQIAKDYGESWSFDRNSAIKFGSHAGANYLLSGLIHKQDVDWQATLHRFAVTSHGNYTEAEDEISIPHPEKILNYKIELIRWKK